MIQRLVIQYLARRVGFPADAALRLVEPIETLLDIWAPQSKRDAAYERIQQEIAEFNRKTPDLNA